MQHRLRAKWGTTGKYREELGLEVDVSETRASAGPNALFHAVAKAFTAASPVVHRQLKSRILALATALLLEPLPLDAMCTDVHWSAATLRYAAACSFLLPDIFRDDAAMARMELGDAPYPRMAFRAPGNGRGRAAQDTKGKPRVARWLTEGQRECLVDALCDPTKAWNGDLPKFVLEQLFDVRIVIMDNTFGTGRFFIPPSSAIHHASWSPVATVVVVRRKGRTFPASIQGRRCFEAGKEPAILHYLALQTINKPCFDYITLDPPSENDP